MRPPASSPRKPPCEKSKKILVSSIERQFIRANRLKYPSTEDSFLIPIYLSLIFFVPSRITCFFFFSFFLWKINFRRPLRFRSAKFAQKREWNSVRAPFPMRNLLIPRIESSAGTRVLCVYDCAIKCTSDSASQIDIYANNTRRMRSIEFVCIHLRIRYVYVRTRYTALVSIFLLPLMIFRLFT